jgi:hypothetical protein
MKASIYYLLVLSLVFFLTSCDAEVIEPLSTEQYDDEQLAQQSLVAFLENLHDEKFEKGVGLYGGTYEIMNDHNPSIDPTNHVALMKNACTINGAQCLEVKSATLDREVSAKEFAFRVEFLNEDGTLFVLGPCCGGNQTDSPPQSAFLFTVIKDSDGKFLVMNMPPYVP